MSATQRFKAFMTLTEITEIIEDWIKYGDDPFEDAYSEIYEKHANCKDPAQKAVLKDVLKLMDVLQKYNPRLQ